MIASTENSLTLLRIRTYGDAVLRRKAKPVEAFDDDLKQLIPAMLQTMYAEPGIGLAAPQVGVGRRVMVIDVSGDAQPRPMALINPTIVERRGRIMSEEGCLSFPGIQVRIPRSAWVRVQALNLQGFPVTIVGEELLGRCLQHEMDHLDGILMIDHLPLPRRLHVLWNIRRRKKAGLWK